MENSTDTDTTGSLRFINSTFIWDISDFPNQCKGVGESIESPEFEAGDLPLNKINWHLSLYPFGEDSDSEYFLSVYLNCSFCSDDITEIEVFYQLYLWDDIYRYIDSEFNLTKFNKTDDCEGYNKFLKRNGDELKNHLSLSKDSTLRIACYISSARYNKIFNPYREISKHLRSVFLSENLSDVTIEVGSNKLKAHKIILSARSKVFSAMFKHDMTENNESIVKIEDVTYDVMNEVLRFIYCGEVENLDSLSKELLAAADKYSLLSLKKICVQTLQKNLNVSNACEVLNISNLHNCKALKEATIKFVIKNMNALVDTEEFKNISNNSKLCYDIFKEISSQKK